MQVVQGESHAVPCPRIVSLEPLSYSAVSTPLPHSFVALYAASPIANMDCTKTPVLILLDDDNLRVQPTEGREH